MKFRRRSVRMAGLKVAGALLAISLLFSAQMFAERHVWFELGSPLALPKLRPIPVSEFMNTEASLPGEPMRIELSIPGGIEHPMDNRVGSGYGIGYARMVPSVPVALQPAWGFGPSVWGRADLWIPPGAWSKVGESSVVGPPGPPRVWDPPLPLDGGGGPRGWPGTPQDPGTPPILPSIPEPNSLLLLAVGSLVLTRRASRVAC